MSYTLSMLTVISVAALAVIYGLILPLFLRRFEVGNKKMIDLTKITTGATKNFLGKQFSVVGMIIALAAVAVLYALSWQIALGFLIGAVLAGLCGLSAVLSSIRMNNRVAEASRRGEVAALALAFRSASATTFLSAGLALLSTSGLYVIFHSADVLIGLALGGASMALLSRQGSGVLAKIVAATVKTPDSIQNITGNDATQMVVQTDLFETIVLSLVAAVLLTGLVFKGVDQALILPFLISGAVIIVTILGNLLLGLLRKSGQLLRGFYPILWLISLFLAAGLYFGVTYLLKDNAVYSTLNLFFAALIGLVLSLAAIMINLYKSSQTAAKVGAGAALCRTAAPAVLIGAALVAAYYFGGFYGLALAGSVYAAFSIILAATGSSLRMIKSALSLATASGMPDEAQHDLAAVASGGSLVGQVSRWYSAIFAALTLVIFFGFFASKLGDAIRLDLTSPNVLIGLMLGVLFISYCVGVMTEFVSNMSANAAKDSLLTDQKELLLGNNSAAYYKSVKSLTASTLRSAILPGILLVTLPLLAGLVIGINALGSFLVGLIVATLFIALPAIMNTAPDTITRSAKSAAGFAALSLAKTALLYSLLLASLSAKTALPWLYKIIILTVLILALVVTLFINSRSAAKVKK